MDRVSVNIRNHVDGFYKLRIKSIVERDEEIVIELDEKECYAINDGDILYFSRVIATEDGSYESYKDKVTVKYEDSNHLVHTELIPEYTIPIDKNGIIEFFDNGEDVYSIIKCKSKHYLFPQDLSLNIGQELYLKDLNGKTICTLSGLSAMNTYSKAPMSIEDCLIKQEKEETCGKNFGNITTYYYIFLPECENRNSFIAYDYSRYLSNNVVYFTTKFNPYYFYTIEKDEDGNPIEFDKNGNPVRHCVFYGDYWFESLLDTEDKKYKLIGESTNGLYENRHYYNVNLGLSNDVDEVILGDEDLFSELFVDSIENSLTPQFIDMEKVKYSPYRKIDKDLYEPIIKMTIYPHFRSRVVLDRKNNTNTLSTSGNLYYDGWYIDTNNNASIYWNEYEGEDFNGFENFVYEKGKKSDLIGFLNFTDNDVYYKKSKISKSFYRLSFYNSKDPIEQKLLFYSTVFLDSTELFCKYLKQFMYVEDNKSIKDEDDENYIVINPITSGNANVEVVFCENENVESRVDTTITLTNEFDKSRSAEGFNIYLFSDDIPEGNDIKTIYMKVDFNHAGAGKTTPMIMWPKDNGGKYIPVTIDNFIDSLYIPIEIREYNGKYIYTIKDAEYDEEGNLELMLFEPKKEIES